MLRESLANVARHAQATTTEVRLTAGNEVVLTVSDDGIGYVDTGRKSGLRNMLDRAAELDGSFEIRRAGPDGGTVAIWRVPVR